MTTGLIRPGMSMEQAAAAVRNKAIELAKESGGLGMHTEMGNRSALVGVARLGKGAVAFTIAREEYDGLKLLEILGLHG